MRECSASNRQLSSSPERSEGAFGNLVTALFSTASANLMILLVSIQLIYDNCNTPFSTKQSIKQGISYISKLLRRINAEINLLLSFIRNIIKISNLRQFIQRTSIDKDILITSTVQYFLLFFCPNNFIMQNEKSWGFSTKSSSNFINSPSKQIPRHKTFKLEAAQQKQSVFLREKNRELQDLVLRMGEQIMRLSKDKQELLSINSKYIDTLNKQFKQNHAQFEHFKTVQRLPKNGSSCKCKILFEFETDYRNLVKHCMNLQEQIKSKNADLSDLQNIRKQLAEANHTSVHELIDQLIDTTHELITLKKVHNQQEFQIQKCNQKFEKMQLTSKQSQKMGSTLTNQLQNYKSLINTIQNQSIDKQNHYESKIYSLQLTIQKLQKDLREQQKQSEYVTNKNTILKAQQIQYLKNNIQQKLMGKNSRGIRSQSMQKVKNR